MEARTAAATVLSSGLSEIWDIVDGNLPIEFAESDDEFVVELLSGA